MNEEIKTIVEHTIHEYDKRKGIPFARIDLDDFNHPKLKKLNWNERIVYWIIYFRSSENSLETWSVNSRIAKDARMKVLSVQKIIPRLKKKGIISIRNSGSWRRVIKCLIPLKMG